MVGGRLIVQGSDHAQELIVPSQVAPQRVENGVELGVTEPFHTVDVKTASGLHFVESFRGALFEIEDERNFGDGFFKIYGPPIRDGYSKERRAGSVIEQSATLRFDAARRNVVATPRMRSASSGNSTSTQIKIAKGTGAMPPVGIDRRAFRSGPTSAEELGALGALSPAHIRYDFDVNDQSWPERYAEALDVTKKCNALLECALSLDHGSDEYLMKFATLAALNSARIARVLVYSKRFATVSPALMDVAAETLGRALPGVALFAASSGELVELIREKPYYAGDVGVAFSSNPGVHLGDDEIAFEGLFGQADGVASLHNIYPSALVAVSPITIASFGDLRGFDETTNETSERQLLPIDDVRLDTLTGAAWIAGSIAALVSARTSSLTYANFIGAQHPRPFVHVLGAACEMQGAPLLTCSSEREEIVRAVGVAREFQYELMAVNLSSAATEVEFLLPDDAISMSGCQLNDGTLDQTTKRHDSWQPQYRDMALRGARVRHRLAGYSVGFYVISRQSSE
jgi:hypothetical protein